MDEQQTQMEPRPDPAEEAVQPTEDRIIQGCLTAFVLVTILGCTGAVGFIWTEMQLPEIAKAIGMGGHAIAAGVYGGLLVLVFGATALLLTGKRFTLWRGLALALAIAGGHALVLGGLLAFNHAERYPTLPYWLPSLVSIAYSLAMIRPNRYLARPAPGPLWVAAGLGLLISIGWLWVGTLGNIVEIWLSAVDALASALIGAVLIRTIFFFDKDAPARRPFWSALIVGAVFAGSVYGLLAVRGYAIQGGVLGAALLLAGVLAGAIMTLDETPDPTRTWWGVLVFLFFVFLVPYTWTEGFEGDYMYTDLAAAWTPAIMVSLLVTLVTAIGLLAGRRWLVKNVSRPAVSLSVVGWAVVVSGVVYLGVGRPGIQPETFFVVLKDQPDTSQALGIRDLDERRQRVFDTLTTQAEESQADLRAMLDSQGVTYRPFYLVNAIEVDGNPIVRAQIAARPDVDRILDSPHARSLPSFTQGFAIPGIDMAPLEPGWNITETNVDKVWEEYGVSGEGIVIGSADTGVEWTHPAIRKQYLGSEGNHDYTWYDPWFGHTTPDDVIGHGTHTTGIVVGQGGIGVAPSAKWIACRNLARDLGNPAVYLSCMQFLFAPFPLGGDAFADGAPSHGADVVNNSWGCPVPEGCDGTTLSVAIEHLYHAGQMYVVSAGNDGPDCATVNPPANAEYALSVGAIGPGGTITSFSSRGPITDDGSGRIKPDVAAPGSDVMSSVPGGKYTPLPGTSMAGPHVTGLVALLWSANPALKGDIDRTMEIIEQTAHHETASDLCGAAEGDQNNVYGYGWIDALAAVEMAMGK